MQFMSVQFMGQSLEWNSVFIIGWEESVLPHSLAVIRLDEERRLAYVGITRAKEYQACRT